MQIVRSNRTLTLSCHIKSFMILLQLEKSSRSISGSVCELLCLCGDSQGRVIFRRC